MAKTKKKQDSSDEEMDLDEELLAVTNKKSSSSSKRKDNDSDESDREKSKKKKKTSSSSSSSSSSRKSSSSSKKKEESEDEEDEEIFNDGYDEDMYENEEDRLKLSMMTQLDREEIIATRYERRKQLLERFEQRKTMNQMEKKDNKDKSSSRSSAATSSSSSSSSRSTRADKTDQALKDMMKKRDKAQRSRDEEREKEREKERDRERETSRRDSEKSREKERDKEREREKEQREKEREREREKEIEREIHKQISALDIQTLNQVRLSRNMLLKWVDQPYFEKLTPGFLVRVVIGQHLNSPVYRIGQIESIRAGTKLYKVETKETDKILVLTYAGVSKEFFIDNVSNNTITPAEHEKWITDMVRARQKLPTLESIQVKIGDIQKAADYIYTDDDIEKRAQERAKHGKIPVNIAFAKAKLIMERDSLEPGSDQYTEVSLKIEEFNRIQADIKQQKQDEDIMVKINKKNKDFNFHQQQNQTITDTVSNEFDPFARRKTRANAVVAGVLNAPISPQPSTAAPSSADKLKEAAAAAAAASRSTPSKLKQMQEMTLQEIHQSIDLHIHIPDNVSKVQPLKKKRPLKLTHRDLLNNNNNNDRYQKNSMSVEDYIRMSKK
ncbi:hypothetical protein DFA_05229 [Cavenderia fasciculata]|uniref:Plus3 domain-containing protein n=1 Tax=Cavenderia fasciculata TaxID=261658 RepID=F4PNP6_CACFS|nr:uncharacterized protein DFA_05229 [Cavenderia fasciculata]EGG23099.1 hypothetical protein DFA_05229 [Cavenderia fasciculata]|eukprot:XP_004360950.1 hypothetical protein DFA_05229 [Cavenderia fasciculata]